MDPPSQGVRAAGISEAAEDALVLLCIPNRVLVVIVIRNRAIVRDLRLFASHDSIEERRALPVVWILARTHQ